MSQDIIAAPDLPSPPRRDPCRLLLSPAAGRNWSTTACRWMAHSRRSRPWEVSAGSPYVTTPQWPGRSGCARWAQQGLVTDVAGRKAGGTSGSCQQTAAHGHDWRIRPRRLAGWHGRAAWLGHRPWCPPGNPQHLVALQGFLHGAHHAHGVAARGTLMYSVPPAVASVPIKGNARRFGDGSNAAPLHHRATIWPPS